MSDEEIKVIEKVKEAIRVDKERRIVTIYDEKPLFRDQLQIIIDLISNQQKEIEKLNFENHMVKKWNEQLDKNCISKDKIREKIKEQRQKYFDIHDGEHSINEICFESTKVEGAIEILKELIEEEDGDHIPRID